MRHLLPTRRLIGLLTLPMGLALGAALLPALTMLVLVIDGLLLGLAVLDALRAAGRVEVSRSVPRIWSVGRSEQILLTFHSHTPRALQLRFHQSLFPWCEAPELPLRIQLAPNGRGELGFRVTARRRGRYTLGAFHLRLTSPWGLWERQQDIGAEDAIQVWPDIKQLSEYDLLARQNRQGLLTRAIRRPGNETEFDRLRPYQNGDEYRKVDWKATARQRQPIVRQLRQATDQSILFLLDCGRPMTTETDGRSALDYALDTLLLVGHVALKEGDKVGMIAFDTQIRAFVPPMGGHRAQNALLRNTCDLFPTLDEPDYTTAFALLRARVRRRSLVVLLSHLLDEATAEQLTRLFISATPHLVLWVCLRDPAVEALAEQPNAGPDTFWERGAAAEVLVWRRRVLDRAAAHGIGIIDVPPSEFTPALLDRYLDIKARHLL